MVGSATLSSALEKLYLSDVGDAALRLHALVTPHEAVDDRIADAVRSVDATDLGGRRAASRRESLQADASHPPTAMRVDHLARRGALTPMVTVSDAERAALAEETTRLLALARNTLVARHLAISAAAEHEVQRDLINRFGNVCAAGERRARSLTAQGWVRPVMLGG